MSDRARELKLLGRSCLLAPELGYLSEAERSNGAGPPLCWCRRSRTAAAAAAAACSCVRASTLSRRDNRARLHRPAGPGSGGGGRPWWGMRFAAAAAARLFFTGLREKQVQRFPMPVACSEKEEKEEEEEKGGWVGG